MQAYYELKDKLSKELEQIAKKDVGSMSLDVIEKLTSSVKNLCKIIKHCEEDDGYSRRMSYDDGGVEPGRATASYARGRRYAPRDSMGRYSGDGYSWHSGREMADELRGLMHAAPDEETRRELERIAAKVEHG